MAIERVETVVVGGGQSGLSASYHLARLGHEHVVLEKAAQAGNAWRNGRWDSFTLVTPNWSFRLPGAEYDGAEPNGFMGRDQVVSRFERYVEQFEMPVRFGVTVTSIDPLEGPARFRITTDAENYDAANVVMASGLFQRPKVPAVGGGMPAGIDQLHSGEYRNPEQLRDGAVLVVGSAQSGCQVAQELYQSGRQVYLCIGSAGRVPRRYRGRDIFEWFDCAGMLDRRVEDLSSPRAKFAGNPHVSGKNGGQNLNLHQFARDGVVLLGHLAGVEGDTVRFAADRDESLRKADAFEAQTIANIDRYIDSAGIDAPAEELPALRDGFDSEQLADLSLSSAGIGTIIWATGYSFDFGAIRLPVVDDDGYPLQKRGVSDFPGLYFVGMPWLDRWKSGLLIGVGEHARYIAEQIAAGH